MQAKARSLDYSSNNNVKSDGKKYDKSDGKKNDKLDGKKNDKSDGKKNDKSDGKKNDRTQAKKEKGKGLKVEVVNSKKNDRTQVKKEKGKGLKVEVVNGKKSDSKKENKIRLINFTKESSRDKEKILENRNGGGSIINLAENADKLSRKNVGDSKKKFPREMEGTKSWRGKSSWNGSRRLGSTRRKWRPDRAYDFGRNDMEINDRETPNDQFDLARIV